MVAVNPNVLRWAREAAGLSAEEAAQKAQLKATKHLSASERILELEEGRSEPTGPQLEKLAEAYRRPLITLYLQEPPVVQKPLEDYRTLPDRAEAFGEATLQALVRDVRARQELVRALMEELDYEHPPLAATMSIDDGVGPVARHIARLLGYDRIDFRGCRTPEDAFSYLRTRAETAGAFVLLAGNLGSAHTDLDTAAFRGFAIADEMAPFIVINDKDAKAAWSFTLLHELAHIVINRSGISGAKFDGAVERFCNDVASSLLLDDEELRLINTQDENINDLITSISDFAYVRNLSGSLVAYRLYKADLISLEIWERVSARFRELFLAAREADRARRRPNGGPNYYTIRKHRVGNALLRFVDNSMHVGVLTPTKAAQVLGVKPRSVYTLLAMGSA